MVVIAEYAGVPINTDQRERGGDKEEDEVEEDAEEKIQQRRQRRCSISKAKEEEVLQQLGSDDTKMAMARQGVVVARCQISGGETARRKRKSWKK
ncbi:hypothetical protein BHM03_00061139 [Ensete ventricosum]|nr:hypothetical protein BHM03_00061139 [Ensete ventricosum]